MAQLPNYYIYNKCKCWFHRFDANKRGKKLF